MTQPQIPFAEFFFRKPILRPYDVPQLIMSADVSERADGVDMSSYSTDINMQTWYLRALLHDGSSESRIYTDLGKGVVF